MLINSFDTYNFNHASPNFCARPSSLLTKKIKFSADSFEHVCSISENYGKISEQLAKYNFITQTKIKALYPNLVSGEKIKGYVFDSIFGLKGKRFQVAKYNQSAKQDELITFNLLDEKNRKILNCRVTKDGFATLTAKKEDIAKLSNNPFAEASNAGEVDYLNELSNEFKDLKLYTQNYKSIKKFSTEIDNTTIKKFVSENVNLKNSVGLKQLNNSVIEEYNSMSDILGIGKHRDATLLKDEYFQKAIPQKTKGLIFKNIDEQGRTYSICPLNRKSDNAIFKVSVHSSAGELENNFVFYPDGVVAMQKNLSESPDDF
ncbi:hypothetical protein IJZ97_05865, partial [bacterium]|nr:hypothetical protein [bacterium]